MNLHHEGDRSDDEYIKYILETIHKTSRKISGIADFTNSYGHAVRAVLLNTLHSPKKIDFLQNERRIGSNSGDVYYACDDIEDSLKVTLVVYSSTRHPIPEEKLWYAYISRWLITSHVMPNVDFSIMSEGLFHRHNFKYNSRFLQHQLPFKKENNKIPHNYLVTVDLGKTLHEYIDSELLSIEELDDICKQIDLFIETSSRIGFVHGFLTPDTVKIVKLDKEYVYNMHGVVCRSTYLAVPCDYQNMHVVKDASLSKILEALNCRLKITKVKNDTRGYYDYNSFYITLLYFLIGKVKSSKDKYFHYKNYLILNVLIPLLRANEKYNFKLETIFLVKNPPEVLDMAPPENIRERKFFRKSRLPRTLSNEDVNDLRSSSDDIHEKAMEIKNISEIIEDDIREIENPDVRPSADVSLEELDVAQDDIERIINNAENIQEDVESNFTLTSDESSAVNPETYFADYFRGVESHNQEIQDVVEDMESHLPEQKSDEWIIGHQASASQESKNDFLLQRIKDNIQDIKDNSEDIEDFLADSPITLLEELEPVEEPFIEVDEIRPSVERLMGENVSVLPDEIPRLPPKMPIYHFPLPPPYIPYETTMLENQEIINDLESGIFEYQNGGWISAAVAVAGTIGFGIYTLKGASPTIESEYKGLREFITGPVSSFWEYAKSFWDKPPLKLINDQRYHIYNNKNNIEDNDKLLEYFNLEIISIFRRANMTGHVDTSPNDKLPSNLSLDEIIPPDKYREHIWYGKFNNQTSPSTKYDYLKDEFYKIKYYVLLNKEFEGLSLLHYVMRYRLTSANISTFFDLAVGKKFSQAKINRNF